MVKSLKVLNPADKARKEARKKELKKNKKQRQQVRSAAIEKKDPEQIIADLEKLDRLEYDVATNSEFSDTLHKEKRKRLKETFSKILTYYSKEDPERHAKLQRLELDYEAKHKKLAREFEAIKAAQDVKIEDIFLPPEPNSAIDEIADDDPLLSDSVFVTPLAEGVKPPGCPPGLPPDFKQLVENLKTSLEAQMALETLPLPANLMNLGLTHVAISSNSNKRHRGKGDCSNKDLAHQNYKQTRYPRTHKKEADTPKTDIKTPLPVSPTKPAVIESKPVIFMQKATKFVPSSVRSKIARTDSKE